MFLRRYEYNMANLTLKIMVVDLLSEGDPI